MKIYLLQVMCCFNEEEHYEDVYSNKEKAVEKGLIWLDDSLKRQYNNLFEEADEKSIPELKREQLFKLKSIYDFSITEYDPKIVDECDEIENLLAVENYDLYGLCCANLKPLKITHNYDYSGNEKYISGLYIFNHKGERREQSITMRYEDYNNTLAGTKFKQGDIVKIKNCDSNYAFKDKLHVVTDVPHKKENQEFFMNNYNVIVNHNSYDEGCHRDTFHENDLELYTGILPTDSPLVFLSKYFKGEIKLKNIKWSDIECGNITLNENKSFRDVKEIMSQTNGWEKEK